MFAKFKVIETIHSLKPKKSPGYDLITAKILKELPDKRFYFLTGLLNAVLRLSWKVAETK